MENIEPRPAPSPEHRSPDPDSPLHPGSEAADPLAFEPVPLRYRADGLTPEKQRAYVEALADCGIAREAAARVGLTEQAINRVRRRADARSFDNACEAAHVFGARRLRSIAYERAVEGTLKSHYYRGELVGQDRVYDNRLLTYLYGKVAHLFDPSRECLAICSRWEEHMDALELGLEPPDSGRPRGPSATQSAGGDVWEDDDGVWWTGYPPPAGFDGEERGAFGDCGYERTLSAREQAAVDAQLDEEDAERRALEAGRRDRCFGFAGDEASPPVEAEPYETSDPSDADLGPIEYKSLFPPAPGRGSTRSPSRHPRERGDPVMHLHPRNADNGATLDSRLRGNDEGRRAAPPGTTRRTFPSPRAAPR